MLLKNIKRNSFILIIITFLLSACSVNDLSYNDKIILLDKNFKKLNEFRAEGVADFRSQQLSLKKDFIIRKNSDCLRIDVLDSGILGLMPAPFASAYFGDEIYITNYNKNFFEPLFKSETKLDSLFNFENIKPEMKIEIIKKHKLYIKDFCFIFDKSFKVKQINNKNINIKIKYFYDEIDKLIIEANDIEIIVKINSIIYKHNKIKKIKKARNL